MAKRTNKGVVSITIPKTVKPTHRGVIDNSAVDWAEKNPKAKGYIGNKPISFLEIDTELKRLNLRVNDLEGVDVPLLQVVGVGKLTIVSTVEFNTFVVNFDTPISPPPSNVQLTMMVDNGSGQGELTVRLKNGSISSTGFVAYVHDGSGGSGGDIAISYLAIK